MSTVGHNVGHNVGHAEEHWALDKSGSVRWLNGGLSARCGCMYAHSKNALQLPQVKNEA